MHTNLSANLGNYEAYGTTQITVCIRVSVNCQPDTPGRGTSLTGLLVGNVTGGQVAVS